MPRPKRTRSAGICTIGARDVSRFGICTIATLLAVSLGTCLLTGCGGSSDEATITVSTSNGETVTRKPIVLRLPMRTDGPKTLDPVRGSTVYDNRSIGQIYETLVDYKYLGPLELEPLLLAELPEISEDGHTYRFKLKQGVYYHDDACFPDGKGRHVKSSDVFYSWKRMADNGNSPKSWWLLEGAIKGFDEYRAEQNEADEFDYDAPVEGMRIINDLEFEVELNEPVYRFMYVLAMFQTSIIPREAVEKYGDQFGLHAVGTGPFVLRSARDWSQGNFMILHRNPNYHECHFPSKDEVLPENLQYCKPDAFGKRLPIADRLEYNFFIQDQPMWLKFRSGEIDYALVPAESFPNAFIKRTRRLQESYANEGIVDHAVPLLDYIFRAFNMEDELVGGYDEKSKFLRQAISLGIDWNEFNRTFYNDVCLVYDGPIPPGLDGHPENGRVPKNYRGPDVERANELLAKAGYPGGEGLPPIEYYTSRGANYPEQTELMKRQLKRINVEINEHLLDFSSLMEVVTKRKAAMFSFAWSSDYPDGENNLALFYGPNSSPGSNHANYSRPEYDELYKSIRGMAPSPERTKIYEQMRDMVIEDVPCIGALARTRYYTVNPRLKNFLPTEMFYTWVKYLDVAE